MPRTHDITVCLVGFDKHKATLDLTDDTGFWLRVNAADAGPFEAAFEKSPEVFHEFQIDQRVGKETRRSTLVAQIVKVEHGPAETRVLVRPHPTYR